MKTNGKKIIATTAIFLASTLAINASSTSYAAITLTLDQKKQLQYLVEEEKLARDVYNYLAANVTTQKFSNIAKSEQTHMTYIANLLKTYKVYNPAATTKPGVFKNAELQKLYNDLIASGKVSVTSAFAAGVTIEQTDIEDLQKDLKSNMPADVNAALETLLRGSQSHLAAFSR